MTSDPYDEARAINDMVAEGCPHYPDDDECNFPRAPECRPESVTDDGTRATIRNRRLRNIVLTAVLISLAGSISTGSMTAWIPVGGSVLTEETA